ncbi:8-oxo-dGTP diphosphatase [Persephonella hydrogeniphila]|uniref:8-oxo-dGTP diphosphatase n=1 Tax=Persephonella hydrogeniphila TaxID=198703 RepID=A0A285N4T1_9AQUI|nr:NUDIX hydrolase [Persephonella hydrogeniphila]SNZ02996.1 8-oxo-dGTP diphosphatase [Persephonella hydrogeniphila]
METKWEFSAGGVVYRKNEEGEIEILLIRVKNRWSFPKGNIERGEPRAEAALREVKEETGVDAEIVEYLGEVDYWYSMELYRIHKFVYYYLMRYKGGDIIPQKEEIDEAKFIPLKEVEKTLTYPTDKKIFERALEVLKKIGEI